MKTEILTMLRETDGYVSGQELCGKFGVSRTAVWKAIHQLQENGYEITAVSNKGYRLTGLPDRVDETELQSIRKTQWAGQEIRYFSSVDSTNTKAKELAEDGFLHGTLVVAEQQTGGRGRRGKGWESVAGSGIFMTLLLKPELNPNNASMLTLVAALAVAKALEAVCGADVGIKWPNDIVISGKKVCGILTEMSAQFDYINHIVIGIGVNVHNESFPEEMAQIAGSVWMETGKRLRRAELIEQILEHFEKYYEVFLRTEDLSGLFKEYNAMLVNMHKQVKVLDPKDPFEGKAMGITNRGELIVDTWESRRLVSGGEVSVRGIYGYV